MNKSQRPKVPLSAAELMVVNMAVMIAKLMPFTTSTTLAMDLVPLTKRGHIVLMQYWKDRTSYLSQRQ